MATTNAASPQAVALQSHFLTSGGPGADLNAVYAQRGYEPIWTGASTDTARAFVKVLQETYDHGLPVQTDVLRDLLRTYQDGMDGDFFAKAEAEVAFSRAYTAYAAMVQSGLLTPKDVDPEIHVFPADKTAGDHLFALSQATDQAGHIARLTPQTDDYKRLQEKLSRMRDEVAGGGWLEPAVPEGRTLRPGDMDQRVPAIRARLRALGDMPGDPLIGVPDTNAMYDPELEFAVLTFQRRHGLNDDGVIGARTLRAMNRTADERLRQVIVNLERARWLNRDLGDRHIYVNMPDYRMHIMENGRSTFTSRVVIGEPEHKTPEFSDVMTFMVANPTWTVPRSITTEEILPELKADPTYLVRNNMRLLGGSAPIPEDSTLVDYTQYSERTFPWWIRQASGPGNALGRVKFMFPNQFDIYLHDTPSRHLFRRDARAFSHGCVRVHKPMELAHALLAGQVGSPESYFQRILGRGTEATIKLQRPVPVHLTYRTSWVDGQGDMQFREDIYGRDKTVFDALSARGVQLLDLTG
ncbi:MAG: L,D-transpeptidase family protein [Pseudomonadota bacterium]